VPAKAAVIAERGLAPNQKCMLVMDLHHSHLQENVLQFCSAHNIVPLYIPGGCTALMQPLDLVVNKPFKTAIRASFGDHLHYLFDEHVAAGKDPVLFHPSLKMSDLKPRISTLVEAGMNAIRANHLRSAICHAFANQGGIYEMRTGIAEQAAATALLDLFRGPCDGSQLLDDPDETLIYESGAEESDGDPSPVGSAADDDDSDDDDADSSI
jgi:hypothetical protein